MIRSDPGEGYFPAHGSAQRSAIVVFDGLCNFCSGVVQFIIERDPAGVFKFASIQSATGSKLLKAYGLDPAAAETILLIKEGRSYMRSDAAVEIAKDLKGFWKLAGLLQIVPHPLRDVAYRWVARNRYRWFGKRQECLVPTAEVRARFLE